MSFQKSFAPASSARPYVRRPGGFLGLLLVIAAIISFLYVGRWLVVQDPLDHAQAIVVLSGRMPVRVQEAVKLYRAGYAPEVWLTHSTEPGASLQALGVKFVGEEIYNRDILMRQGVPAAAIHILEPPIESTADEMVAIKGALAKAPTHIVIIVTTKAHTRRVRALWNYLVGDQGRAIVRAASDDPYDADHWWRSSRDALDVTREVLGLINVLFGLPLGGH
jgi:hypothetical protein